jgi:hypothetical protein
MSVPPSERLLERIRAEYLEMPGLCLTSEQVQRLCGVERTICQLVLDSLVDAKFLYLKANGAYARLSDGATSRPRPAKGGPETKQLGAARDEASCVVKSLGRSEGASVVVRIIVEPCGGLHNEIGVPRKEWRHVHDG